MTMEDSPSKLPQPRSKHDISLLISNTYSSVQPSFGPLDDLSFKVEKVYSETWHFHPLQFLRRKMAVKFREQVKVILTEEWLPDMISRDPDELLTSIKKTTSRFLSPTKCLVGRETGNLTICPGTDFEYVRTPEGKLIHLKTGHGESVVLARRVSDDNLVSVILFQKADTVLADVLNEAELRKHMASSQYCSKFHGIVPLAESLWYEQLALVIEFVGTPRFSINVKNGIAQGEMRLRTLDWELKAERRVRQESKQRLYSPAVWLTLCIDLCEMLWFSHTVYEVFWIHFCYKDILVRETDKGRLIPLLNSCHFSRLSNGSNLVGIPEKDLEQMMYRWHLSALPPEVKGKRHPLFKERRCNGMATRATDVFWLGHVLKKIRHHARVHLGNIEKKCIRKKSEDRPSIPAILNILTKELKIFKKREKEVKEENRL